MEVLTLREIIAQYKVSAYFIRRHRVEMGLRGKPLRGERSLVEDFFRHYFRQEIEHCEAIEAEARARAEEISRAVDTFRARQGQAQTGKINGKLRPRSGEAA